MLAVAWLCATGRVTPFAYAVPGVGRRRAVIHNELCSDVVDLAVLDGATGELLWHESPLFYDIDIRAGMILGESVDARLQGLASPVGRGAAPDGPRGVDAVVLRRRSSVSRNEGTDQLELRDPHAAQQTAGLNHQADREYREDLERWRQEYDAWQQRYVTIYRLPPPPVA